jgi:hypothetical protein
MGLMRFNAAISSSTTSTGISPRTLTFQTWRKQMIDWAEGHHAMKQLVQELYEVMLKNDNVKARDICQQIIVEARLTRAMIQENKNV